jgi:opacity protein-like surface antigen
MSVRKLSQILLVVAVLCSSAAALHAQSISVFGMGTFSSLFDKGTYTVPAGQFSSSYNTGGGFTVGAESPLFLRIIDVEGSYSLVRNNLQLLDQAVSPSVESAYGVRNQRVSGDLVGHLPKYIFGFRPYLAGGVEFDRYSPLLPGTGFFSFFNGYSNVVLHNNDSVGFNYGGGVDLRLARRVSFRVDLRDHVTGSPTYGLPSSSTSGHAIFPIGGYAHDLEYSAGVVFRLGKK